MLNMKHMVVTIKHVENIMQVVVTKERNQEPEKSGDNVWHLQLPVGVSPLDAILDLLDREQGRRLLVVLLESVG